MAEDLVQEVFLRVYRHIRRFDQTREFSIWVYKIGSNLAKNELRNRSRHPLVLFSTLEKYHDTDVESFLARDISSQPDREFEKRHLRELVEENIEKLPVEHRIVFMLREVNGLSYNAISEIVDCPIGTVKSRLCRARRAFAKLIEPHLA